ncbi:MAG: Endopeptidase La, partial [Firmicutes bacterium]|nr:Endopeptidase La [Bacillota bacterium]
VQLAAGIAQVEKQDAINMAIIKKVLNNGRFAPRLDIKPRETPLIGVVNGLAVHGANIGTLIEVEAAVIPVDKGTGKWTVTGVIEEEQIGSGDKSYRRKSMAKGAVENVLTVLKAKYGFKIKDYDIHINFPGGVPVDGPSAGVAMATAIYSALQQVPVNNLLAMTGELSVHGRVKPVGGVMSKVEAARNAGIKRILIPQDNMLDIFNAFPEVKVIPVSDISAVFDHALFLN